MTRTVAVIQARLGSQRFPEKMLADLGGRSLLDWVVTRVSRCRLVDKVIVATTQEPLDDRLVRECERLGVDVRRGSTNDVLARFVAAIRDEPADVVVRICADNPFVDPGCVDQVIREYRESGSDYAFNHRPFGDCDYADGFGAEVISRRLLEQLNETLLTDHQREHVTLAIVDESVAAKKLACRAPKELAYPRHRFDIDEPADHARLSRLIRSGGLDVDTVAARFVEVAETSPGS